MRGVTVVFALAAPVTLLVVTVAAAADGPRVGSSSPGARTAPLAAVQASETRKELGTADATSHRGTRLRANDAATPPFPETAPAMSASLPLATAPGGSREAAITLPGARAPPAAGRTAARVGTTRGSVARGLAPSFDTLAT